MATILPLNKSEINLLKDMSIELGSSFSYLEKDYYLVQLIQCLQCLSIQNTELLFTGGTALAKAYKTIHRFSEDCDFILTGKNLKRAQLSKVKTIIHNHLTSSGFDVINVTSKNNNQNMEFSIRYETLSTPKSELRKELKLEIIYKEIKPKTSTQNVQSFLSQAKQQSPEVSSIKCLSIEDIATGKISALIWRYLSLNTKLDRTLIRHLYDLASLHHILLESTEFKYNSKIIIKKDLEDRLKEQHLSSKDAGIKLISLFKKDSQYKQDYSFYLENFLFTPTNSPQLTFETSIERLQDILNFID